MIMQEIVEGIPKKDNTHNFVIQNWGIPKNDNTHNFVIHEKIDIRGKLTQKTSQEYVSQHPGESILFLQLHYWQPPTPR